MSAISIARCQAAGTSPRNVAGGLPAFDERHQRAEHGPVAVVELLVRLRAGVDGDERVVAPERAPRRRDDSRERVGGVAALAVRPR